MASDSNISIDSSLLDHRILCVDLKLDIHFDHGKEKQTKNENQNNDYMINEEPIRKLEELTDSLAKIGASHEVDKIYGES